MRQQLVEQSDLHDLPNDAQFADFDLIGFKETAVTIDLVAFVRADFLSESAIVALRERFFELTQRIPRDFAFKPRGRNPNGLLGFVFKDGCPRHMVRFIKKRTQAAHIVDSAVIVSWAIDLREKHVHTHDNPVSFVPPLIILPATTFPNLTDLTTFVQNYQ